MAPIDGGMREQLEPGMVLTASYRKAQHRAEVIAGEDGKLRFRLADGREFTSPSAAGSAVMGGIACNGWRFWSLATDEAEEPKPAKQPRAQTAKPAQKPPRRTKAQPGAETEEARDETPPGGAEEPGEPVAAAE